MIFVEIVRGENLSKFYDVKVSTTKSSMLKAVEGVNISIQAKEVFGLVGESGSGKSTLGRLLLWLEQPSAGRVLFKDLDLLKVKKSVVREARRKMQVVFQNPDSSLDPRMKIGKILLEGLECSGYKGNCHDRIKSVVGDVGLRPDVIDMFPHHLSGGMKQRVAIARVILAEPEFIVLDEPTSALDVSVQAQILNLLTEIQKKFGLSYLFISHNLSVVSYVSDRVGVMYLGELVEIGESNEVFNNPLHPYTKLLISSVPSLYMSNKYDVSNYNGNHEGSNGVVKGCKFSPRCPYSDDLCRSKEPRLEGDGHLVSCYHVSGATNAKR